MWHAVTRASVSVTVLVLGMLSGAASVCLEASTSVLRSIREGPAVAATHPLLRARLIEIARRSSSWRQAIAEVTGTGRQVIVLTPAEVVVAEDSSLSSGFDDGVLAEVMLAPRPDTRVDVVFVVVNLPLMERIQRQTGALPAEMEADLDRILVHEVYGHALPYLLAGDLSGKCSDPQPGQRAREACAIRRENAVRAELGFDRRIDYGLHDLALIRRAWQ